MTTAKPTGTCPVCNRPYQLKTNGTLRNHWKRDGMGKGLPFSDPCSGVGQPPTAITKPRCTCGEGPATLHWSNCALYTSQLLGAGRPPKEQQ